MNIRKRFFVLLIALITLYPSPFTLFAEVIVEVRISEDTTLETISKKYLKEETLVDELSQFNENLPKDKSQKLNTDTIRIPKKLLKNKVGDVAFLKTLVKTRKENEIFWRELEQNQRLFPGDGVMTWSGGTVKISFLAGGNLTVATDSLMFLKETERRPVTSFLAGNISVDDIKVVSHGVEINPKKGSLFNVNTSPEKVVRLSVHKGAVDVTAKNKTVTVKEGFKTEVKFNRKPEQPTLLPSGISDFHNLRVLEENEKYHLQIALDRVFELIAVDKYIEKEEKIEEEQTKLEPGGYYLRISLLTKEGFESRWSNFYYFVKGPESSQRLKISSINQISEDGLEVKGFYPGIQSVGINGYSGKIFDGDKFVCKFKVGDDKMFSIFIQSDSGSFAKRYKKSSSNLWLPIGE